MNPGRALAVIVICGIAVIGLGGVVWWAHGHQSCTVGIAGTDLEVTATGDNPQQFCDGFVQANNGSGYSIDQPDQTGTLMCRYTIQGDTIEVRDKGLLKVYGSAECQSLAKS